jgi:hypothetical protein
LDALVLQPGEGLTGNFLKMRVPESLPVNEWTRVTVNGIRDGELHSPQRHRGH